MKSRIVLALLLALTTGSLSAQEEYRMPAKSFKEAQIKTRIHNVTGRLRFLSAAPGTSIAQPPGKKVNQNAEDDARHFLSTHGRLFGLNRQYDRLDLVRERKMKNGRTMHRFQQVAHGLPVVGGLLNVNMDAARNVLSINGEVLPALVNFDPIPTLQEEDAADMALQDVGSEFGFDTADAKVTSKGAWIYNPGLVGVPAPHVNNLVWRFEVSLPGKPLRAMVLVDARTGHVLLNMNQVPDALDREVYDFNCTATGTLACSGGAAATCTTTDNYIAGAFRYSQSFYDFFDTEHGRDSFDDAGATMVSNVHTDCADPANAYWDGTQIVFIDGLPLPMAEDVVCHEWTHAFTDYSSNLFYFYQSGAINESMSDVWGEIIDQQTNTTGTAFTDNDTAAVKWQLGEDAGGAIRNMQDPTLFGDPDKMSSSNYSCGIFDNGGVHINSGINNKAVYLMTDGGTFNGYTVTGIGWQKVVELYYEVQTNYLISGSDYNDLCDALVQAATNLGFTTSEVQSVQDAVDAVEMCSQPTSCANNPVAECTSGTPINLFFDDIESGGANWTLGANSGTNNWSVPHNTAVTNGPYAVSGNGNISGPEQGGVTDTFAAMTYDVVIPPNAWMHFKHAHWFGGLSGGGYTFDNGGFLEYSANGGAWTDAGSLMVNNGYNSTIVGPSSPYGPVHPRNGQSAFMGALPYYDTKLDLSSLSGDSVKFRFRIFTHVNHTVTIPGWFIDDVRIYTCGTAQSSCDQNQTITSNGSGNWNDPNTWNPVRVPNSNDIVTVNAGHTVTVNVSSITLRGLCNSGNMLGSAFTNMNITATEFIYNDGRIWAADGYDGSGASAASWVNGLAGMSLTMSAPDFHNDLNGTIQAGRAGNNFTWQHFSGQTVNVYAAAGGNVMITGARLLNEGHIGPDDTATKDSPGPTVDGGNGGIADNSDGFTVYNNGNAYGGNGGSTIFLGTEEVENTCDGVICSGNGGYANTQTTSQSAVPGIGGALVFTAPSIIQDGILCAGGDGDVLIEPWVFWLQCGKIRALKNLVLFGGDEWRLVMRSEQSGELAVEATGSITVAMGQGGILDLSQVASPIFRAEEVIIYSNEIILPEGMELEQLVDTPNLDVRPARILYDVRLNGVRFENGVPNGTIPVNVNLINNGPEEDLYVLSAENSAGWPMNGLPDAVSLPGLSNQTLTLNVDTPSNPGLRTTVTVTAQSKADPTVSQTYSFTVSSGDTTELREGMKK